MAARRHCAQQSNRCIDAVVEAVPVVLEEQVPAHLARQRTAGFKHLGLDQRVAGLPHQWRTAQFGNALEEGARRFDITDDRCTRQRAQHRLGEQTEELVAPDDAALPIDRAEPVAVAVEGQPHVGTVLGDGSFEVGEVVLLGRVGVVIREGAVDIGEQQHVLAGQPRGELLDHRPGGTVAGVPHHRHWRSVIAGE